MEKDSGGHYKALHTDTGARWSNGRNTKQDFTLWEVYQWNQNKVTKFQDFHRNAWECTPVHSTNQHLVQATLHWWRPRLDRYHLPFADNLKHWECLHDSHRFVVWNGSHCSYYWTSTWKKLFIHLWKDPTIDNLCSDSSINDNGCHWFLCHSSRLNFLLYFRTGLHLHICFVLLCHQTLDQAKILL